MVLPFQTQEVAREDVHEAQLPAVLIDVEVRHYPHDPTPGVQDSLLADFVVRWSGMLMQLQPDQGHRPPFLTEPSGPRAPLLSPSWLDGSRPALFTQVPRSRRILGSSDAGSCTYLAQNTPARRTLRHYVADIRPQHV